MAAKTEAPQDFCAGGGRQRGICYPRRQAGRMRYFWRLGSYSMMEQTLYTIGRRTGHRHAIATRS